MNDTVTLETVAASLEHLARIAKQSEADMLAYLIAMAERECVAEIKKRTSSTQK